MNGLNHRHSVKLTNLTCTKQLNVAIKYFGDTALWEPRPVDHIYACVAEDV